MLNRTMSSQGCCDISVDIVYLTLAFNLRARKRYQRSIVITDLSRIRIKDHVAVIA